MCTTLPFYCLRFGIQVKSHVLDATYRVVGVTAEYRAFKTPLLQGTCEICENGIGDETHFLNYCHYLVNIVLESCCAS